MDVAGDAFKPEFAQSSVSAFDQGFAVAMLVMHDNLCYKRIIIGVYR